MNDTDNRPRRRVATLLQGALALLVAGTLVAFSVVALQTGFAEDERDGLEASGPGGGSPEPIRLPSERDSAAAPQDDITAAAPAAAAAAAAAAATDDTSVLGRRIDADTTTRLPEREPMGRSARRGPPRDAAKDDDPGRRSAARYDGSDERLGHGPDGYGYGYGHAKDRGKGHGRDGNGRGKGHSKERRRDRQGRGNRRGHEGRGHDDRGRGRGRADHGRSNSQRDNDHRGRDDRHRGRGNGRGRA